ncbi:hypothetical protein G9F31_14875, partial [Acinetobacter sp. 187]|uniref:ESPR-type extended signal peptide-containing protein n=1 Tax=Acinetobacter lanii TaxID=2715163 RepID=UPI00140AA6C3
MNKIYKVIWNATLGTWVAVSELAKGKTKSSKVKAIVGTVSIGLMVTFSADAGAAWISGSANTGTAYGTASATGVALGSSTSNKAAASGENSIALGNNSNAVGNNAISLGGVSTDGTTISFGALGESYNGSVVARYSTSLGSTNKVVSGSSVAIGNRISILNNNNPSTLADLNDGGKMYGTTTSSHAVGIGDNLTINGGSRYAVAIGADIVINQNSTDSFAFGRGAIIGTATQSAEGGVAIGAVSKAQKTKATAIGSGNVASGAYSTAIGSGGTSVTQATADGALALGGNATAGAKASATNAIAIGGESIASANKSVAIGTGSSSISGEAGIALGAESLAHNRGVSIGGKATSSSTSNQAISIGYATSVIGDQSIAIGANTIAEGNSSISIGGDDLLAVSGYIDNVNTQLNTSTIANTYKTLTGDNLVDKNNLYVATVSGEGSVAVGIQATAGDLATAFGTRSNAKGVTSVALGVGATASKDGAVALGAGAKTDTNATKETSASINGVTYSGFTGSTNLAEGSQVSVGSTGYESQIKNLAAGAVSASSTDAINGSQLYAVALGLDTVTDTLGTKVASLIGGGSKYDPVTGTISDPSFTINGAKVSTLSEAISSINAGLTHFYSVNNTDTTAGNYYNKGATGANAIALGVNAKANFKDNIAIGTNAISDDGTIVDARDRSKDIGNSIAVGTNAYTFGKNQVAIGSNARAISNTSLALGYNSNALGAGSSAIGTGAAALESASLAFSGGAGGTELKDIESKDGKNSANNGYRQIVLDKTYRILNPNSNEYELVATGAIADGKLTGKINNNGHTSTFEFEINKDTSTANNIDITKGKLIVDGITKELSVEQAKAVYQSLSAGTAIATAKNSTAIGYSSLAFGEGSNALGAASMATGNFSTAIGRSHSGGQYSNTIGYGANTNQANSLALGTYASTNAEYAIAIGSNDSASNSRKTLAEGVGAIALGGNSVSGARATQNNAIAIGAQSQATGLNSIAQGLGAQANADRSIAQGLGTQANGKNSIAIGSGDQDKYNIAVSKLVAYNAIPSSSTAERTKALQEYNAALAEFNKTATIAKEENAIALGKGAQAQGKNTISIGTGNVVLGHGSGAIGDPTTITGSATYSLGNNNGTIAASESGVFGNDNTINGVLTGVRVVGNSNTIQSNKTIVLGNNVTVASGLDGAVVLGDQSTISASTPTANAEINGTTYDGFAGVAPAAGGVVSVGAKDAERQIQHVAAGQISDISTDAINGSQLYAVALGLDTTIDTLGGDVANIIGGGSKYDPVTGTISDPSFTINGAEVSTLSEAISSLNAEVIKPISFAGDSGQNVERKLGEITHIVGGITDSEKLSEGNIGVVANGTDKLTVQLAKNIDLSASGSLKIGNTSIKNDGVSIVGGPSITASNGIDAGNKKITNVLAGDIAVNSTDAINGNQLFNIQQQITQAINSVTTADPKFKISSNDPENGTSVAADSVIDIGTGAQEKNIKSSISGQVIDFTLSDKLVDLTSVTAGVIDSTNNTLKNGAQLTSSGTKVIDGDNKTADYSAAKTELIDGAKKTTIDAGKTAVSDGKSTTTIGADTITVGAGSNPVVINGKDGVIGGLTNTTWNEGQKPVTGQAATEDQVSALETHLTNKGLSITAQGGTEDLVKLGETVDYSNDDKNIEITVGADNQIKYNLADDITVKKVIAGNTVVDKSGVTITDGTNTNTITSGNNIISDGTSTTTVGVDTITVGAGSNPVVINGKDGVITGLTNTTLDDIGKDPAAAGQAATQGQVSELITS